MADISRVLPVDDAGRRYQGISNKLPHGTQFGTSDYADGHVILKSEGHVDLLSGPNPATDNFANPTTASILTHLLAWVPGNAAWERLQSVSGALKVFVASLPLPTGAATSAKQPALGTAGSASTDVITVQGIASGTAQPISGTVTANAGSGTQAVSLASVPSHAVTTVDGGQATVGTTTDAAAAAGAGGTLVAQLRAISRDLVANIVLKAGSAIIGKVGIDQTTPGTTDSVSVATGQGAGAAIGATSGTKVITDAAGTMQQYLRGLAYFHALFVEQTLGRLLVLPKYSVTYSAAATSGVTNIKASAGVLHSFTCTPITNASITFYDTATTTTGTPIASVVFPATLLSSGPVTVLLDIAFSSGLAWNQDSATRGTVAWL